MPRKLIMCGDHPVLAFEYDPESGRACSSGEVLDHDRLPLEFTTHGKSALYAKRIDEWWRSRAIPSTRDGIRRVLESLGAASTGELLDRTYGLSLSDQYWVRREDDPVEWKETARQVGPYWPGAHERGHRLEALHAIGRSGRPVFPGTQRQPSGVHMRGHALQS